MKSNTSSCTTTYLLLITFCILFVYIVLQNDELKEGLKTKDLNKFGKKIKKETESFATALFTIGIVMLFAIIVGYILASIVYAVFYISVVTLLPTS